MVHLIGPSFLRLSTISIPGLPIQLVSRSIAPVDTIGSPLPFVHPCFTSSLHVISIADISLFVKAFGKDLET